MESPLTVYVCNKYYSIGIHRHLIFLLHSYNNTYDILSIRKDGKVQSNEKWTEVKGLAVFNMALNIEKS